MQKPQSIQRFDMFYLGSIAVSAVGFFLGFDQTVATTRAAYAQAGVNMDPSGIITGSYIVGLAIGLLLWWLTSRGGPIAKWILVILFGIGILALVYSFASGTAGGLTIATGLQLLSAVLSAVAVYCLFQPDANAWFDRDKSAR